MDSSNIYSIRQMLFSCQQGVEESVTTASVFPQALIAAFKNESRPLNSLGLGAVPTQILAENQLLQQH